MVYSDAMFRRFADAYTDLWRDDRGMPFSRVAFVVFVPGRRPVVARMVLPDWVWAHLSPTAHTLIQQAELIAAVGVYRSVPELVAACGGVSDSLCG